jgi:hypothetical protein
MTVVDTVKEQIAHLPPARQLEVLEFVQSVVRQTASVAARHDPEGILANPFPELEIADFKANRREMMNGFPREIEP